MLDCKESSGPWRDPVTALAGEYTLFRLFRALVVSMGIILADCGVGRYRKRSGAQHQHRDDHRIGAGFRGYQVTMVDRFAARGGDHANPVFVDCNFLEHTVMHRSVPGKISHSIMGRSAAPGNGLDQPGAWPQAISCGNREYER